VRPVQLSRYSDTLRVGSSGDRTPVGARFSGTIQPDAEATESLVQEYRICYPKIKRTDTPLTTHSLIVPRLSADRAIPTATDLQCSKGQPLPLHNAANRLVCLIRVPDAVAGASGRAV